MSEMCTAKSSDPFHAVMQWTSDLAAGCEGNDVAKPLTDTTDVVAAGSSAGTDREESVEENSTNVLVIEPIGKPTVGKPSPNDSGLGAQVESPPAGSSDTASSKRSRDDRRRAVRARINAERMRVRALYHAHAAEEAAAASVEESEERFIKKERTPPAELSLDFSDWEVAPSSSAASSSSNAVQPSPILIKAEPPAVNYSSDRSFSSLVDVSFNSSAGSTPRDGSAFRHYSRSPLVTGLPSHRHSLLSTHHTLASSPWQPSSNGGLTPPPRKSPRFQTDAIGEELSRLSPTGMAGLPRPQRSDEHQPSSVPANDVIAEFGRQSPTGMTGLPRPRPPQPQRPQPQASLPTGIIGGQSLLLSIKQEKEPVQASERDLPTSKLPVVVKREFPAHTVDYTTIKKVRIHKRADYEAERAAKTQVVLKSCLKLTPNPVASSSAQRRVDYALDRTTTATYEIEEGNTLRPVMSEKIDYVRLTKKFTKIARKKTQIFKKTDTRAMRMSVSGELAALLKRVRRNRDNAVGNSLVSYSRWLIADGVLRDLNDAVFKNMVFTRLEYPMDSSWLLTYGLNDAQFDFEVSYIFVACGAERFEHDAADVAVGVDGAFEPTGRFLRDMHAWISTHVVLKAIGREKKMFVQLEDEEDVVEMAYNQGIPVLVAITASEEGETATLRREFNERLRHFVREFNANELSKLKDEGTIALPIELLDWAKLMRDGEDETPSAAEIPDVKRPIKVEVAEESTDGTADVPGKGDSAPSATERRQESEKRFERLVNELSHSYGVLIR